MFKSTCKTNPRHEAKNCYLLVGYPERTGKRWTEGGEDFGTGGSRGRGRLSRGRGRARSFVGRGLSDSSPANSGWAAAATVQRTRASTLGFSDRGVHRDSPDPDDVENQKGFPRAAIAEGPSAEVTGVAEAAVTGGPFVD
ncbi:hypothetical protein M9H77_23006 [Catharanthus roseus]|uniref:Uncharacterized protein n=1 Tax=Catharanthus roseus TaxID=4058 RepID=A0ACC0AW46_CATRO|nr:hypothetical protein M9H77_23006 [Catharanthus roseus]